SSNIISLYSYIFLTRRFETYLLFFFSYAASTIEIYTLSLHDALPILIDVAQNDGFTDFESTRIRLFLSRNQPKQCRFTRTVRPYNTDDTCWRQRETQAFEQ